MDTAEPPTNQPKTKKKKPKKPKQTSNAPKNPSTSTSGRLGARPAALKPKQCFKCQRWGHQSTTCTAQQDVCRLCSGPHTSKSCPNRHQPRCANCGDSHPASSLRCPASPKARADSGSPAFGTTSRLSTDATLQSLNSKSLNSNTLNSSLEHLLKILILKSLTSLA
jgi:hypothetical protein